MDISNFDRTTAIDSEEARLQEEYEHLTTKLHKQKLLLSVMKNIDCNEIKGAEENGQQNIGKALDFVRAFDYLKMDNAGTNVLGKFIFSKLKIDISIINLFGCTGIPDKPYELPYVEKRALKAKILEDLPKHYEKELQFCRNMEPEILEPEILDRKLLNLKQREQELVTEIAVKKADLCKALNEAIELRFGSSLENHSKLIKAKISVEQVKAQ